MLPATSTATSAPTPRRVVFVTLRVAGFHCWTAAPDAVGYLRSTHRHLFHLRVEWRVDHDERQIEFHMALAEVRAVLATWGPEPVNFGAWSCESLARWLYDHLTTKPSAIEWSEDGECGARVEW